MSDSLLDTAEVEPPTETTTETPTETWSWSEGVNGEGDRPEWFMDKYKSVAEQAAAYPELARKFGGFKGAPEEYSVSFPEKDGEPLGEFIEGDPMLENFKALAKDMNMSQEGFTKLLHNWTNWQIDSIESTRAREIEAIGKDRDKRINSVNEWSKANLSEDEYGMLKNTLVTADAFRIVETLIDKAREKQIPAQMNSAPGISRADLDARVNDPRYQTDKAFRDETTALFRKYAGDGEHREIRQ